MSASVEVTSAMVLSAVWDLYDRQSGGVSAEDIAAYLKVERVDVQKQLLALRTKRILKDRQRSGVRVWSPWRLA